MKRLAFKMFLHPNQKQEYKKRHDTLWPALHELLKKSGISDYSIFLDEETNTLFAVLNITDASSMNELPNHPVMKEWWTYMQDIMQTNADHSPVSKELTEVFYME